MYIHSSSNMQEKNFWTCQDFLFFLFSAKSIGKITTTGEKPTKQPLQKDSVYNDALLHGNNYKHIALEKKISMFRNTIPYVTVPQ